MEIFMGGLTSSKAFPTSHGEEDNSCGQYWKKATWGGDIQHFLTYILERSMQQRVVLKGASRLIEVKRNPTVNYFL